MQPGTRLEHYEIVDKIGEGGMGAVYRAEDTRLRRAVAIKVLPVELTDDEERLARLKREAQLLASLNHPNIATVHGFGDVTIDDDPAGGAPRRITFLVMELVEGDSLHERAALGPVEWREAVRIAIGIAAGLEAAHEKGIIHRDLKPANVQLAADGSVKVLDFGLAKAFEADGSSSMDLSASPTVAAATRTGVILGTAGYMSPEQARGKPVDKRADIWALGCVLYELLTGRRTFDGETISDVLASILKETPDLDSLPPVPERLRALLERCLAKDPAQRMRDVGNARLELEASLGEEPGAATTGTRQAAGFWKRAAPIAGAAVLAGLAVGYLSRPTPEPPPEAQMIASIDAISEGPSAIAISPDGHWIAEVSRSVIRLRAIDDIEWRTLPDSAGAFGITFDASSERMYFGRGFQTAETSLHSVGVDGSSPTLVASLGPGLFMPFRGNDGRIYTSHTGTTLVVSRLEANGSLAERFRSDAQINGIVTARLAGDRWLAWLFNNASSTRGLGVVGAGDDGVTDLMADYRSGRHLGDGLILAVDGRGQLASARIDPDRGTIVEPPVIQIEGLALSSGAAGAFDISDTGMLVYLAGPTSTMQQTLSWLHRNGTIESITERKGIYQVDSRVSPDGRSLALELTDGSLTSVWIHDLERDVRSALLPGAATSFPVWSPDGKHVAYYADAGVDAPGLYRVPIDRSTAPVLLLERADGAYALPTDWSSVGHSILYVKSGSLTRNPSSENDLWMVPAAGGEPQPVLAVAASVVDGRYSPDGKWIAYQSNQTEQNEIYLRPAGGGGELRISAEGGTSPEWRADGRELFFQKRRTLQVVDVDLGQAPPRVSAERELVTIPLSARVNLWSPAPDGERFLVAISGDPTARARLHAIFNWGFLNR